MYVQEKGKGNSGDEGRHIDRSSNPSVFSPLMFYIQANEIEALKKLLERTDIKLNEQDDDGNSALMMAASGGHLEAFEILLCVGANIKLSNKYRDTAISLLDVNQRCDVNAFDADGYTPLMLAARGGYGGNSSFVCK
ncbi:hypothetical protein GQ457_18G022580 [Hibiscus cannabinus]